ncbi:MAG: adaptor protein MecA [Bacillota bacterium]|nr:adaptor protein MecA [Bacillota bacterium]
MTIIKAGEDGVLITLADLSDNMLPDGETTDYKAVRSIAQSVISMLGLSWQNFWTELYSFQNKLLIFVFRERMHAGKVFAFDNIDDILDASAFIPGIEDAALYLLDDKYYLLAEASGAALAALMEYSACGGKKPSESYIKEHGRKIMDHSSITRMSRAFTFKNSKE